MVVRRAEVYLFILNSRVWKYFLFTKAEVYWFILFYRIWKKKFSIIEKNLSRDLGWWFSHDWFVRKICSSSALPVVHWVIKSSREFGYIILHITFFFNSPSPSLPPNRDFLEYLTKKVERTKNYLDLTVDRMLIWLF